MFLRTRTPLTLSSPAHTCAPFAFLRNVAPGNDFVVSFSFAWPPRKRCTAHPGNGKQKEKEEFKKIHESHDNNVSMTPRMDGHADGKKSHFKGTSAADDSAVPPHPPSFIMLNEHALMQLKWTRRRRRDGAVGGLIAVLSA